jgi:FlaA1/EpsC-like NDP-sugar epimerase
MKKITSNLAVSTLAMPRLAKRFVVIMLDLSLCVLTVWLAYYLRLGEFTGFTGRSDWANGLVWASLASIGLAIPLFIVSGLYRAIFRYSDWPALLAVARAIGIYGLLYATLFTAIGVPDVPRTIGIIQPILLLLFVGASRAFVRIWLGDQYSSILITLMIENQHQLKYLGLHLNLNS